jgi:hypothetical protein
VRDRAWKVFVITGTSLSLASLDHQHDCVLLGWAGRSSGPGRCFHPLGSAEAALAGEVDITGMTPCLSSLCGDCCGLGSAPV